MSLVTIKSAPEPKAIIHPGIGRRREVVRGSRSRVRSWRDQHQEPCAATDLEARQVIQMSDSGLAFLSRVKALGHEKTIGER